MALSFATQHRKRVERLVQGVKEYALLAGVPHTVASRRILNRSGELKRLEDGGLLSPATLEKREAELKIWRRRSKANRTYAESAA
jgi:hypothetical protein